MPSSISSSPNPDREPAKHLPSSQASCRTGRQGTCQETTAQGWPHRPTSPLRVHGASGNLPPPPPASSCLLIHPGPWRSRKPAERRRPDVAPSHQHDGDSRETDVRPAAPYSAWADAQQRRATRIAASLPRVPSSTRQDAPGGRRQEQPPQQHRREPACLLEWVASAQSPQDSPSRRMGPNSGSCSRGLVFLPTKPERGRLFPALSDEIARSWTSGPCYCLKSDQSIASPMGLGEMVALNQPCRAVSPGVQAAAITNGYRGAGFGSITPANSTQTPMEERSTTSDFIDNTLFTPPRQVTMSSTSNGRG